MKSGLIISHWRRISSQYIGGVQSPKSKKLKLRILTSMVLEQKNGVLGGFYASKNNNNSDLYVKCQKLCWTIQNKRRILTKGKYLYYNKTHIYVSLIRQLHSSSNLVKMSSTTFFLYSPDVVLSDYYLFTALK